MRRASSNRWSESTHAELAWGRARASAVHWAWAGALIGILISLVCFVPASWLASAPDVCGDELNGDWGKYLFYSINAMNMGAACAYLAGVKVIFR